MEKRFQNIVILSVAILATGFITWWLTANPTRTFAISEPGADNRLAGNLVVEDVQIGELFNLLGSSESELKERWPRFRGEELDNISKSPVKLINEFADTVPDIQWSVKLGEGHAGAVIYEGLVYILDYDEEEKADLLRCYDLVSGKELWHRGYHVHIKRNHGKSRTIPAVTDKYIVSIGPKGHVMCLNRKDGSFRWGINILKDYQTTIPDWYTGQCPLIDDGVAVIASCGTALMLGIDCESGEILWETPNPKGWNMTHASVVKTEFAGKKLYIYSTMESVFAVSADAEDRGRLIWESEAWRHNVVSASPVCLPNGKIFLSASYGTGCMVIQMVEKDGQIDVEVLDSYKPSEGFSAEQQTPIFYQGHLFSILPKYASSLRNQFVCIDPSNFREMVWTSGKSARFGLGPYIVADGKFYILSDDGVLTIARASTKGYTQLDQAKVFEDGHDAWAPMALADGYLVLRDSKEMVCINLRK